MGSISPTNPQSGSEPPPCEGLRCSFCGKRRNEVKGLVAGWTPHLAICNECVELCAEILAEERQGDDPRAAS